MPSFYRRDGEEGKCVEISSLRCSLLFSYSRQNLDSWFNCYGVDTNRNWDFHWGEGGASPDTCSETYRGNSAVAQSLKQESQVTG